MAEQFAFSNQSHEKKVDAFYGIGVEKYGDYHEGYLNFGLWDEGTKNYLEAAEKLIRTIGRKLGLSKDSHLLDVASGMGTQDVFIHKEFGSSVDSVDVTWKHILVAEEKVKRAGFEAFVHPHHGTATKLSFSDETFTHALCVEGGAHFNTREDFIREAYRVLKPGGRLGMTDYVLTHWPKKWWEKLIVSITAKIWCVPKANYETGESLAKTFERIGFKHVEFELVGAKTIPGYFKEARRADNVREQIKIRGWLAAKLSFFIDYFVYKSFTTGAVEYILITGEK